MKNLLKRDAVVLDSNAHTGELMFLLRRFGISVEGIESNPYYLTYAAHEFGIQLNNVFLDSVEVKKNHYNAIFSYQMLDKYQDPLHVLRVFRDSLKDNGYLHIVLQNCEHDTVSGLRQYGLNVYTASCLFKIAGFKILNLVLVPENNKMDVILIKSSKARFDHVKYRNRENYLKVLRALESRDSILSIISIPNVLSKLTQKIQVIIKRRYSNNFFSGTKLLESTYKSYIPKIE